MTNAEIIKGLKAVRTIHNGNYAPYIDGAIKELEQKPRKGEWISKPHVYGVTYCSECDFELKIDDTNYCPNCGAKMVDPQESPTGAEGSEE